LLKNSRTRKFVQYDIEEKLIVFNKIVSGKTEATKATSVQARELDARMVFGEPENEK